MKGFLLDENLPETLPLPVSLPIVHAYALGRSVPDTKLWDYAERNDFVIVTKDADFTLRIAHAHPPPRVVHLRIGNMRRAEFARFVASVWPKVESQLQSHKLVNVYQDRIESFA